MRKYMSVGATLIGAAALIYCIIKEVDGIGRAALIFIGLVGIVVGLIVKPNPQ